LLEKKKAAKKSKRGKSSTNNNGASGTTGLLAGDKFLTPSIEYYKNVAN
jgi:hypothetical protein